MKKLSIVSLFLFLGILLGTNSLKAQDKKVVEETVKLENSSTKETPATKETSASEVKSEQKVEKKCAGAESGKSCCKKDASTSGDAKKSCAKACCAAKKEDSHEGHSH